jgi:hypothetical protein
MARGKGKAHPTPPPAPPHPDTEVLRAAVVADRCDDTIIIFIPSHDGGRPQKPLTDQDQWADTAMRLFSRLYGGATAFRALQGIWKDDDGTDLWDQPIMIQSLAKRELAESEANLEELADFARRLCRETRQKSVAVVCNSTIHFVRA